MWWVCWYSSQSGRRTVGQNMRPRHYVAACCGVFATLFLASTGGGPLSAKRASTNTSLSDRTEGTSPIELLTSWAQFPLGVVGDSPNQAINLVKASIAMGPVVMVLGLWLYLSPLKGRAGLKVAPIVAATLATAMLSQPPFLYSWIFSRSWLAAWPWPRRTPSSAPVAIGAISPKW